jgi:hypothetical protein
MTHTGDSTLGAKRRTQATGQNTDPQSGHKARGLERNGFGHGRISGLGLSLASSGTGGTGIRATKRRHAALFRLRGGRNGLSIPRRFGE